MNDWINDNILALKFKKCKNELIWCRTRLTVYYDIYFESCMAVKKTISESKAQILQNKINDCKGDQKINLIFWTPLLAGGKTAFCQSMTVQPL